MTGFSTVYIVYNGTGGEIDSVWATQFDAEQRQKGLNHDAQMILAWGIKAMPVQTPAHPV